jgi:D-ribose pyranose/furanose isomerase RbsD
MLNRALYRLFNSLPFKLQNKVFNTLDLNATQITTTKTLFKLNLSNFKQANEVEIYAHLSNGNSGSVKTTHMLIYQDYETLSTWSSVESIVIVSPNFPIQSHAVSADLDYVNGFPTVIGDVRHETEIMEISINNPVPAIIYEPKEYRFMSMKQTDSGLTNIIFKIYYRFKNDGSLVQIKAGLSASFSLKLMLRKIN